MKMFNNPYFNGFREPQQPITQNFQLTNNLPNEYFMAKFLKNGEVAENQYISAKTAFIDLANKQLKIRDTSGETTTYGLILPMDEKDLKISSLEQEIKQLKEMINNESNVSASTINESAKSNGNDSRNNKSKSSNE